MLLDRGDLGVGEVEAGAGFAAEADAEGVALEGAEDEGVDHALDVVDVLGVGEGAVGCGGVEAVQVLST